MCRRGAVTRDELVDLRARHRPRPARLTGEDLQAIPRRPVRGDVGVEIHGYLLPGTLATVTEPGAAFLTAGGDVVTGEAVRLELRLAKAGSRGLALVIDATLVITAFVVVVYLLGTVANFGDDALLAAIATVSLVAVLVGIPVTLETITRGRSLGKLALGLRVVRDDGGPIRFRQAFVRGLTGMFEIYLTSAVPALIASLVSSRGKRVGDLLAGTVVLQERVPAKATRLVEMPQPLAGWAATVDLSRIDDGLALAVRRFLGRAPELAPEVRSTMEAQLANAVAAAVAPPPPPGTPAWALLAAVVAERHRRAAAGYDAARAASAPASTPPAATERVIPPAPAPASVDGAGRGEFTPPA
jgi:uncharacterized RDD family membrane protein YckC